MADNILLSSDELRRKSRFISTAKNDDTFKNGSTFWYYTRTETATKILNNNTFFASNFKSMNDVAEAKLHGKNAERVHALCFCQSNSEKIPMWYLYSGLSGKGIAIGFTPARMLRFINSIEEIEAETENATNLTVLKREIDFEIQCGWVCYRKSNSVFSIKNKFYEIPIKDVDGFTYGNYFIKDYPWEYEKEFRFVIINHTGKSYCRFHVHFPEELLPYLKIKLAPEYDINEFENERSKLPGLQRIQMMQVSCSALQINMNLYKRNKNGIVQFLERANSSDINIEEAEKIRNAIQHLLPDGICTNNKVIYCEK